MEKFVAETLEASMSNPEDSVEVTLLTDAASVGITTPLHGSRKRVKLTEDFLRENASSFKGMPITLEINDQEDSDSGKLVPHSKTVIGVIKDAYFDEAKGKIATVGSLWKHYFPKTLKQLNTIYKAGKAQVSWELLPEELKPLPEEGDDVFEAVRGRFVGQAVVNHGADLGNAITLLAAAAEEESDAVNKAKNLETYPVGSFEWVGEQVVNYLTAGSDADNYTPKTIVGTFPDRVVYTDNGKFYQLPIEIEGTNIKFSDTIEVEPIYQPLGASAAGSTDNVPEAPPSNNKEAGKSNMVDIDEKELETLKASKAESETRVGALEADLAAKDTEIETLKAAVADAEAFKAQVEADKAEQAANTLAASRIEEVEKILPYEDQKQKAEDLETFKTMDEKSFEVIKRTLQAAAEAKGGAGGFTGDIANPWTSREDQDGQASQILNDPVYQAIKQSYAAPTKEAN